MKFKTKIAYIELVENITLKQYLLRVIKKILKNNIVYFFFNILLLYLIDCGLFYLGFDLPNATVIAIGVFVLLFFYYLIFIK